MEACRRFEIQCRPELRDFEDLVALHYKVSKRSDVRVVRISRVILFVLGIILLLDSLFLIWLARSVTPIGFLALAAGVVALVLSIIRPRLAARQMMKNSEKIANHQIVIDDDGIHVHNDILESVYKFDSVENIYQWRNSYVLYVDKVHVLHFPFRQFTEGDPISLAEYLYEKCGLSVQTVRDQHKKEQKQ